MSNGTILRELWPSRFKAALYAPEYADHADVRFDLINVSLSDEQAVALLGYSADGIDRVRWQEVSAVKDTFSAEQIAELTLFLRQHGQPFWRLAISPASRPNGCEGASHVDDHDELEWLYFRNARDIGLSFQIHAVADLRHHVTLEEKREQQAKERIKARARRRKNNAEYEAQCDGIPF